MKISSMMIGIVIVGLMLVAIGGFIMSANEKYSFEYNNSELESFQKVKEIYNNTKAIQAKLNKTSNPGIVDKLGGFLGAGIDAGKTAMNSYDLAESLIRDGTNALPMSGEKEQLRLAISTILLILVVFAILLFILKVKG